VTVFEPKETLMLHGFSIGLDKDQVPFPILKGLIKGWYEASEVNILRQVLAPGDRLLEMGTAIGLTAMSAARIIGHENVMTFELNPLLIEWAKDNFKRNGFEISVQQCALMAESCLKSEYIDFHIQPHFWGSSLIKRPDTCETISVKTKSFEQVVVENNINSLLIDIEGGELDFFLNADLTGIDKIIMETHYDIVGKVPTNEMLQHVIDQGFFLDLSISEKGVVALYRL